MEGISVRATGMSARFQSKVTAMRSALETDGRKAVEAQVQSIRQLVINTTPVDTGNLKARWGPVSERGTLAYGFGNPTDYGSTLEYGGYTKVGPRTIRMGGGALGAGFVADPGIYSRQAPLGFVRKALAQSVGQFHLRLRNILRTAWGGLGQTDAPDVAPPVRDWRQRQTAISPTGQVDPEVLHRILASFSR